MSAGLRSIELGNYDRKVPNYYLVRSWKWIYRTGFILLVFIFLVIFPILCIAMALLMFPFDWILTCAFGFWQGRWSPNYNYECMGLCLDAIKVPGLVLGNYRSVFQRQQAAWDYEMGKPPPLPQKRKRRLSLGQTELVSQSSTPFLTKLPAELRLHIYGHVIAGDYIHLHVAVHRTKKPKDKRTSSRIHGHPCSQPISSTPTNECTCYGFGYYGQSRPHGQLTLPENQGRGCLALSKTCKQIYMETINLLYRLPTFYFNSISQPPYFLHSVLPDRLAQIRSIQLCYNQHTMNKIRANDTEVARHQHWLHQCAFCNVNLWLDMIRKHMTGLQTVEVFVYLDDSTRLPTLGDSWIVRLLKLQHGNNGLRDLKIHVYPGPDAPWTVPHGSRSANLTSVMQLDKLLQDQIRKGAEKNLWRNSQGEGALAPCHAMMR